jgi:hypothetical protein
MHAQKRKWLNSTCVLAYEEEGSSGFHYGILLLGFVDAGVAVIRLPCHLHGMTVLFWCYTVIITYLSMCHVLYLTLKYLFANFPYEVLAFITLTGAYDERVVKSAAYGKLKVLTKWCWQLNDSCNIHPYAKDIGATTVQKLGEPYTRGWFAAGTPFRFLFDDRTIGWALFIRLSVRSPRSTLHMYRIA